MGEAQDAAHEPFGEDVKQKADEMKDKANSLFKEGHYTEAVEWYTKAIELLPSEVAYYSNRSLANLRAEFPGSALADANKALEIDPSYVKAYYRRASANMAMGRFKAALKDYEGVYKRRPKDPDAKSKFEECSKMVRRKAFEKAIAVEHEKPMSEQIDVEAMAIEEDYSGPVMKDENMSESFAMDLIETFRKEQKLHRKFAYAILLGVLKIFKEESSLVSIDIPEDGKITVCGDIHGQFYDLLNIFKINGYPSPTNPYLFNGDFVDRGAFSVEVILTLFTFKLLYPSSFFLCRGNHESYTMNQMYGFEDEVKAKYSPQMAELFTEIFNWLPLAHLINSKVLVMHGGLFAEDNISLDDIRKVDRNCQPPDSGIMCDLLWSDPMPSNGRAPSKRGVGTQFGPDITEKFCSQNNLHYVVRSHEVKQEGYEIAHNGKCITIFSAPNYCDSMGNDGAFLIIRGDDLEKKDIRTFKAVDHPNVKPMAFSNAGRLFGFL